ncbi:carboxylesterase/lipase family protein [Methylocapsa sp. S129]|uniref:carboxylesterase/lipase family protein n=1 Tax=Methylocapsa sp. S129 TaxID=1641869 RepID=UPI00131A8CE2|nr:carboxylesterase family protein [Methylocapsa sp. S129]
MTLSDSRAKPLRIEGGEIADRAGDASGIRVFKGIPYAAPPVGELRWRKPEPVKPWDGVLKADDWGPRGMQGDRLGDIDPLNKRMSEDCLYLNIWTPAQSAIDQLPVLFWIHGGSNNTGAGSQPEYDGGALARRGVVVVTINYRLDVFGFLAHPDLTRESGVGASGNYGLLDQIAALQWVQNNIAAFGGDPGAVTVFGESAGAMNISLLMVSPLTKGLFARAIGQSGGALKPAAVFGPKPLRTGEEDGLKFARGLGADSIAELRARPAQDVLKAALASPIAYGFGVVDGYVVPDHPAKIYAEGKQHAVPLLVGWNADEGTLFAARMVAWGPDLPSYAERIRTQYKDHAQGVLSLYPPGATLEDDKASFAALFGDEIISYGGWAWAERTAATGAAPVYRYYFNRRPPGAPELSIYPLTAPGSYHSAEICYVWDCLQIRDWPWEAADRRLADAMASYWVNFAKTGNPNGDGLPPWPTYEPGGAGRVMELGKDIGVQGEWRRDRYEFLDDYYRKAASR